MHLVSVVNKQGRGYIRDRAHQDKMQRIAATCSNRQMQQTLQAGIAFHNAGMDAAERAQVEELFLEREILVIIFFTILLFPARSAAAGSNQCHAAGMPLPMQLICKLCIQSSAVWCVEDTIRTGSVLFEQLNFIALKKRLCRQSARILMIGASLPLT